jgi:hypothetical protein
MAKFQIPGMAAPSYVDPNDKIFSEDFSKNVKMSDASQDAAAKEDFIRLNAELEAKGVSMYK